MIGVGGLERYLLALARGLRDRGHDLELITARTDGAAEELGVPIRRIDLRGVPRWRALARFAELAAELAIEADLVLGFGRTWKQDAHRAGGGCHALYSGFLPWWKRWGPKNRLELALEKKLYTGGQTRHFVVNAAPIAAQLEAIYRVPPEAISVIHTAVDSAHFCPVDFAGFRPQSRRPVLLFISSHHRRKGLPTLLRALAKVPEADLWVAGAPLGRYRRLAAFRGVSSRIRELGEVPDLAPVYREADWFVHPTLYDACANTVLQSMASALPGIISAADGASEFIEDGKNGFLLMNPQNVDDLATLMGRALAMTESQRQSMGRAARESILPLTWDAHLQKWESLLTRLAGTIASPAPTQIGRPIDPK